MRIVALFFFLLLLIPTPLYIYSQEELIGTTEVAYFRWGGVKYGWKEIYKFVDTNVVPGRMGKLSVSLADNSAIPDENTEILINFDSCKRDQIHPYLTNYEVKKVDIFPAKDIKLFGPCSGGFINLKNIIEMDVLENSFFFTEDPMGSFTVDFYLYPTRIYDNSEVLSWRSPVILYDGEHAGIMCYFKDGKLTWRFENIFFNLSGKPYNFEVSELNREALFEWHHHAILYNSTNGLLTLQRDGKTVGLKWLTENKTEGGTLLRGKVTRYITEPIRIGRSFFGYMDDFRIARGTIPMDQGYYRNNGFVLSDVIDIGRASKIIRIKWDSREGNGTLIKLYYRLSDIFFPPDAKNIPIDSEDKVSHGWKLAHNGMAIKPPPRGRYLQWKAELFGTGKIYTPLLDSLEFLIELDKPPLAPLLLEAKPIVGGVKLRWIRNKEEDVKGYRIYYGKSSHYYFGRDADLGPSPIDVGNIEELEIRGLENEKVYFFAITAVDEAGLESGFSREIAVRPSLIYNK